LGLRRQAPLVVPPDAQTVIDTLTARIAGLTQEIAALRDSEARWRLMAEATLDGLVVHDFETILHVNDRLAQAFGYAPEELIGQSVQKLAELISLADVAGVAERAQAGDPVFVEVTAIRRDGSRFPIEYVARDFMLAGRRVRVGVGRDISKRRHAEAALAERDERLRLAIAAGKMIAWERIPGEPTVTVYSADHSLAEPQQDLDELRAALHPEDAVRVRAAFEAAVAGDGRYQAEYRARGPDGSWRWLSDHGTVHYDATGKPVRVIGVAVDITAHKAGEAALRDREERFRTILETLPHIAFMLAANGTMTYWNAQFEAYFGKPFPDLGSRRTLFHPDDRPAVRAARDAGVASGSEYAFDARVRRHDGAWRWHAVRVRPLWRDDGTASWLGVSVDIDDTRRQSDLLERRVAERTAELEAANRALRQQIADRERAEAALVRAQKMEAVGQLTGGVAHDFNNLLTAIIGSLEMMQREAVNPRVIRLADSALRAAMRGAELTQQLLSFARRQVLKPVVTDVATLLAEMEMLLRHAGGGAIEVAIDAPAALWSCEIDPAQFQSAILNLVVNARDAMPRGGSLAIEVCNLAPEALPPGLDIAERPHVAVAVRDTGDGMTPETIARAFEPFFSTKDIGKGSGLGLSMVYGFAKQSGGGVGIESSPGAGTCVTLYLPRARQPESADEADGELAAPRGSGAILVVDDDEHVRQVSVEMLLDLGYRVRAAGDGHEALALLRRERFDLLFSDVVMPKGLSGFELARQAESLCPGIKVLLTSGYPLSDQPNPERYRLLPKPFRSGELAAIVAELMDRLAAPVR
jgi:PAS domain S-box-containing protein